MVALGPSRGGLLGRADRGRRPTLEPGAADGPRRVLRQVRRPARGRAASTARRFRATYTQVIRIVPTRFLAWHGRGERHDRERAPERPARPSIADGAVARLPRHPAPRLGLGEPSRGGTLGDLGEHAAGAGDGRARQDARWRREGPAGSATSPARSAASSAARAGSTGLVNQLDQAGLGDAVSSWVSTGPNKPVDPNALGCGARARQGAAAGRPERPRRRGAAPDRGRGPADGHRRDHARRQGPEGRRRGRPRRRRGARGPVRGRERRAELAARRARARCWAARRASAAGPTASRA